MIRKCCWVLGLILILAGCWFTPESDSKPCSTFQSTSELVDLPDFLIEVHPAPGSVIKERCYLESLEGLSLQVGVYVVILTEKMVEPGDKLVSRELIDERINLTVDTITGSKIPTYLGLDAMLLERYDEEANVIATWAGPTAWKSLPVALSPGEHKATVQIRKTSGAVLEYSWSFTIEP